VIIMQLRGRSETRMALRAAGGGGKGWEKRRADESGRHPHHASPPVAAPQAPALTLRGSPGYGSLWMGAPNPLHPNRIFPDPLIPNQPVAGSWCSPEWAL